MRQHTNLEEKQIDLITNAFYSNFCGIDLTNISNGIHFICLNARDEKVKGFNCKYTIYVLVKAKACVIAYAPKYQDFFEHLKTNNLENILGEIEKKFKIKKMQLMIFKKELIHDYGNACILHEEDFNNYEDFFHQIQPSTITTKWLEEYFISKVKKEYFTGYFVNGALVSVCDAPDMPYMEDKIQHTGIVTLPQERRKGHARLTAALATHNLLEKGICPQWECRLENHASIHLAESIGYEKYGIAYIVEE